MNALKLAAPYFRPNMLDKHGGVQTLMAKKHITSTCTSLQGQTVHASSSCMPMIVSCSAQDSKSQDQLVANNMPTQDMAPL